MKRPGFVHGVIVAAVLGFLASAVVATLTPFVGLGSVIRVVIPAMAFAYLLYLFRNSEEKLGRLTTLTLWMILAIGTWWWAPSFGLYLLVHVGAIWLVRCLYFYAGIVPALFDLALTGFGLCVAVWAVSRTGSVFLATWSFFLVQALFVAIPSSIASRTTRNQQTTTNNHFAKAERDADRALQQLFNQ